MKYLSPTLHMSTAKTLPIGVGRADPRGCQFSRSRECQMMSPGVDSKDEKVT